MDAKSVMQDLIRLNELQDTIDSFKTPRGKKRKEAEAEAESIRPNIPAFILSHHDRIRKLGRKSTSNVVNWVCQSCFIAVPVGSRSRIMKGDDLNICENCGAYLYYSPQDGVTSP
ncbi:MAG: C4-type zinc ribbon domain-containing protein [Verrucomicrobiota bacterium]